MDPRPDEVRRDTETTTSFPLTVDEADALAVPISRDAALGPNTDGPPLDVVEQQGLTIDGARPIVPEGNAAPAQRPILRRDKSTPLQAPRLPPPPAPTAPSSDDAAAADSNPLSQIRSLVQDMPTKQEQTSYAFVYDDASGFATELEEWFSYSVEERAMVLKTATSFLDQWSVFNQRSGAPEASNHEREAPWTTADQSKRTAFTRYCLSKVEESEEAMAPDLVEAIEALTYVALGCWHETAGAAQDAATEADVGHQESGAADSTKEGADSSVKKSAAQVEWIKKNLRCIIDCDGIEPIFRIARLVCHRACSEGGSSDFTGQTQELEKRQMWCALTLMYFCLEFARLPTLESPDRNTRSRLLRLDPDFLVTFMDLVSKMRWDENVPLPMTKLLLLIWKGILVSFGGLSDVQAAKDSFRDPDLGQEDQHGNPLITASPLDYHLFRQEISSKYPAYNPPPPLFPLEPENNSILPPLKNHPSKAAGSNVFGSGLDFNNSGTSILHQPVHIATPAPSPPPSPAGPGGKGGKKQNYQTNQMFPFLYPPLDESSNSLGGKGSTDLQDLLCGRKWEGSDIPASILEAAQLFATRMRASRSMKQLWDVRVQFMKYERGWANASEDPDVDALDLGGPTEKEIGTMRRSPAPAGSVEERLQLVEAFYKDALPHLQSLVIVLIRAILNHVTAFVTQANGPGGLQSGFQFQENGTTSAVKNESSFSHEINIGEDGASVEEIDTNRNQEILDKAMTGILVLLLKWFKLSHILKFEYLTQLLVDSSYIPLVLKLLQLQEIEKVVSFTSDQQNWNFFNFCIQSSRNAEPPQPSPPPPNADSSSSEDEALPPPIKRNRPTSTDPDAAAIDSNPALPPPTNLTRPPPEVDELGLPASDAHPHGLITTFSSRLFFTTINYLRILQKLCKSKAHRNLMLVSFKSSAVLRKCLRIPHPLLRLYTLKLFKNQVPYCGRKWRQTNMRVITAVYLHCRPELRDEWLSGSDVDAEVDESVPLEQALRALTHWWNLRCYPKAMGAGEGILDEERDFFRRELEKMGWGDEAQGMEGGVGGIGGGMGQDGGAGVGGQQQQQQQWDGGPLQGW